MYNIGDYFIGDFFNGVFFIMLASRRNFPLGIVEFL